MESGDKTASSATGLGAPYSEEEVESQLSEMLSDPRFQEYVERTGRVRTEPGLFVSNLLGKDDDEEEDENGEMETDDQEAQILKAAEHGDLETVERLLAEKPTLVSAKDADEYTPLHRAAYNNHADVIRLLLSRNADATALTEQGWTPLHCAACWGCDKAALALIESGKIDVNARSFGNVTPLHLVAACTDDAEGALNTAKLLLSQPGIQLDVVSDGKQRPLEIAGRHSGAMLAVFTEAEQRLSTSTNDGKAI